MPSASPDNARADRLAIAAWMIVAALVRYAAIAAWSGNLTDDRDNYLSVARQFASVGFWQPFDPPPSAFRPPLYPLMLSGLMQFGGGPGAWAAVQLLLGTATVGLTYVLARQARANRLGASLASAMVTFDPLLVQYTTFPMTETLCTFLLTALFVAATAEDSAAKWSLRRSAGVGALFSAAALCRPTVWLFGGLAAIVLAAGLFRSREQRSRKLRNAACAIVAAALVAAPWVIRNVRLVGAPVLTTTHGGYTLLLGNNPDFYHQVAAGSFLKDWRDPQPDRFQAKWFRETSERMERELGAEAGEVARDRWMYAEARRAIVAEPRLFARACVLRFLRFWNVAPLPPASGSISPLVWWGIAAGYTAELALFAWGAIAAVRRRDRRAGWMLLAICAFTAAHLVYWSNLRMRAPLVPLIAVVAAVGIARLSPAATGAKETPEA